MARLGGESPSATQCIDAERGSRSTVLLANEKITLSTPISVRPSPNTASLIPSFLSPVKRRQLILTDLPRLVEIKDEEGIGPSPRIKFEAVFTRQSTELASTPESGQGQAHAGDLNSDGQGGSNRVVEVLEKGPKGFIVNTVSCVFSIRQDELT